jgi:LysM repeat protein
MSMIDCATKLTSVYADVLVKNGVTHVGRYLPTTDWKGLTVVEVEVIKEAGLNLISIYEKGSTKASYFTKEQGIEDATHAEQLAKNLNQPEGTAIYFTVDYDAQTKDFANILNYFQGVKDTLQTYKVGVYGKFETIVLLQTKKLADYFWQTYAWSNGQRAKNLHLFQYKNDTTAFGLSFGIDLVNIENVECGSCVVKPSVNVTPVKTKPIPAVRNPVTTYKVVSGDTLSEIADRFKTTVKNLQSLNHLVNPDKLTIGQVLKITGTSSKPPDFVKYKIQNGDTLITLANRHKTTVAYLMHINPSIKNPNKIYVGQTINLPK